MVSVTCLKCNREGSLTVKKTKSKGITYEYWYVEHHVGAKIEWCYLGKTEKLPDAYKALIPADTQTDTQKANEMDKPKIRLNLKNSLKFDCRGSLAWLGRQTHNLENKRGKRL
jgi:hypothetical protein